MFAGAEYNFTKLQIFMVQLEACLSLGPFSLFIIKVSKDKNHTI